MKQILKNNIKKSIDEYTLCRLIPTTAQLHLFAEKLSNNDTFKNRSDAITYIISNWDFKLFSEFIQEEINYKDVDGKYIHPKKLQMINSTKNYQKKLKEYKEEFGSFEFDNYLSGNNFENKLNQLRRSDKLSWSDKMSEFQEESKKAFWIYEINQLRNDAIESIIVNFFPERVLPTLKNVAGVDFYIDGIAYDVKTSRSIGTEFVKEITGKKSDITDTDFTKALTVAKSKKGLVSKSLFENQSLARFSNNKLQNKLYVISGKRNQFPTLSDITQSIVNLDLDNPNNISANIDVHQEILNINFKSFELFI